MLRFDVLGQQRERDREREREEGEEGRKRGVGGRERERERERERHRINSHTNGTRQRIEIHSCIQEDRNTYLYTPLSLPPFSLSLSLSVDLGK